MIRRVSEQSSRKVDSNRLYDNLRRVAISNIRDPETSYRIWWHKKYNIPPKKYEEYTQEELIVENFEDFYISHPQEAERFLDLVRGSAGDDDDSWIMDLPPETLRAIKKTKKTDATAKYVTEGDELLTDEECNRIISGIKGTAIKSTDQNEFNDSF